jgi:hypothetical protein
LFKTVSSLAITSISPVARRAFSVPAVARRQCVDLDYVFAPERVRRFGDLWMFFRAEDNLGETFPIAQIDEDHATVIAARIDPARKGDGFAGIGLAELVTMVRAVHGGRGM